MEFQHLKRRRCYLTKAIWKYKNASDSLKLRYHLQSDLASDTLRLYENCDFVDLHLQSSSGIVYSHRVIVAGRSPLLWHLITKIIQHQSCRAEENHGVLTIYLPEIQYIVLESYIRSLYSNSVNKTAGLSLRKSLEEVLFSPYHKCLRKKSQITLEKLNVEEENFVQQLILQQISRGEISRQKGNLKELSGCIHKPQNSRSWVVNNKKYNCSTYDTVEDKLGKSCTIKSVAGKSFQKYQCVKSCEAMATPPKGLLEQQDILFRSPPSKKKDDNCTFSNSSASVSNPSYFPSYEETLAQCSNKIDGSILSDNSCYTSSTSLNENRKYFLVDDNDDKVILKEKLPQNEVLVNLKDNAIGFVEDVNNAVDADCKMGNLDSDHSHLHETSSLEVEPSSSCEEQSMSADSAKMGESLSVKSPQNNMATSLEAKVISEVHPHKPLVRTRTFEVIEPLSSNPTGSELMAEDNSFSKDTFEASTTPSRTSNEESSIERNSVEYPHYNLVDLYRDKMGQSNIEDPIDKRELERKQGHLIFEHNFQTFSNIPTTNMMNLSMSSEGSVPPIYSSMMSSTHSAAGNEQSLFEPMSASLVSLPLMPTSNERNGIDGSIHISEENNVDMCVAASRSPSPDSLCIDLKESMCEISHSKESVKEKFVKEIKEKDDNEQTSETLSNLAKSNDGVIHDGSISKSFDNPRTLKHTENIPIVSGGYNIRQNIVTDDQHPKPSHTQRQSSCNSVKDVDAIPLVTGFVNVDASKYEEEGAESSEQRDENESKNQSMFSMFIDFNELPSPEKGSKIPLKDGPNEKGQQSGGFYMFIEADTLSPKIKRKNGDETKKIIQSVDKNSSLNIRKSPNLKDKSVTIEKNEDSCIDNISEKHSQNEKKSFFVFLDGDESQNNSPKLKKRPVIQRKTKGSTNASVMSKSAPSDSRLFKPEGLTAKVVDINTSDKLMTKSVIDRDEFMSQPPARRNVSLNDKINESSKIPRPVANFKEKLIKGKKTCNAKQKDASSIVKSKNILMNGNASHLENSFSDNEVSHSASCSNNTSNISVEVGEISETSDVNSLLNSLERSNGTSEQNGKIIRSTLGDDLLKMFLNGVNTDLTIQVEDKKIKAHKCILAFRCAYFAAMLSGTSVAHSKNVIKLQGFSYESVMVALKHIYSGQSSVPEGAKIGELAALADMLSLDGLKDVISLHLKANVCHYFHKPCAECLNGVLEILPLTAAYSLEDIYRKSLEWCAKYFVIVLPTRNFASLPHELQDRCLRQITDAMSVSTIIDTSLGCEKVLSLLPVVGWAQTLIELATQLLESCSNFIALNMNSVLASQRFISYGKEASRVIDNLDELMKLSIDLIRPDQAVLSYIHLNSIIENKEFDGIEFCEEFIEMLTRLLKRIEKFMIENANRVAVCRKWPLLSPDTQKHIKEAALLILELSKATAPKPKPSPVTTKMRSRGSNVESTPRARASSLSDHRLSRSVSATTVPPKNNSLRKVQQTPVARCQTPPPQTSSLKISLQTPPQTRTSLLRAQARQAAIQRSQSERTVNEEKPKSSRKLRGEISVDESSSQVIVNTSASSQSNSAFPRASTFTRSLSRPEKSGQRRSITPVHFNSLNASHGSGSSRPNTPGLKDRNYHKRNSSGPLLNISAIRNSSNENESLRKNSFSSKNVRPLSGALESPLTAKIARINAKPFTSIGRENESMPKDSKGGNIPHMNSRKNPLRETQNHSSNSSEVWKGSAGKRGSSPPRVESPALRSRSNTFSKDEGIISPR